MPRLAVREKGETMVSECDAEEGQSKGSYCVGTTRVETGRCPLDLILFFGGYRTTIKQVRDKVGDCSSLGLQQGERVQNKEWFKPARGLR